MRRARSGSPRQDPACPTGRIGITSALPSRARSIPGPLPKRRRRDVAIRVGDPLDRGGPSAMQVSRLTAFAILALCAVSGCRTAGVNDLARPEPPLTLKSTTAAEILAEHNRNAERIKILEARPSLTITVAEPNKEKSSYSVDGQLTMERPRNFKLKVKHTTSDLADIGSNDKEYWFWVKDKSQKGIYYCNYDESGSSPLAATFQPDWITEAMGLRIIPEE